MDLGRSSVYVMPAPMVKIHSGGEERFESHLQRLSESLVTRIARSRFADVWLACPCLASARASSRWLLGWILGTFGHATSGVDAIILFYDNTMYMLLRYFVASRVRRDLLRVLWVEGASGNVSELSRSARVSYAAAHRELEAMRAAGLALCDRAGNKLEYRANVRHSEARLVRELVKDMGTTDKRKELTLDGVRRGLRALGAPLGASSARGRPVDAEQVLAAGLTLAHDDATVARVLPLVLWLNRDRVDYDVLVREATHRNERQSLGYFLELAGRLGKEPRLIVAAKPLHDRRRTRLRMFFSKAQGRMALASARRNTPAMARRWGYLMNMGLDSFTSTFEKYAGAR